MRSLHVGADRVAPAREPTDSAARFFTFRAFRALILGVLAMSAVAWIVSVPAVLCAAVAAAAAALFSARAARLSTLVIVTPIVAVLGGLAGSFLLGQGPVVLRILVGIVASLAAGPWAVVVGFMLRARALDRHSRSEQLRSH